MCIRDSPRTALWNTLREHIGALRAIPTRSPRRKPMQSARHSLFSFLAFMKPQGFPAHVLQPSQPHSGIWLLVLALLLIVAVGWPQGLVAQPGSRSQSGAAAKAKARTKAGSKRSGNCLLYTSPSPRDRT